MISSLRGILLIVGVLLPLLKLFGLPFLATVSWGLVFVPLIAWTVLFVLAFLVMVGLIGGAVASALAEK
jgi:hypothetical protein